MKIRTEYHATLEGDDLKTMVRQFIEDELGTTFNPKLTSVEIIADSPITGPLKIRIITSEGKE